jgi:hypothetical protein
VNDKVEGAMVSVAEGTVAGMAEGEAGHNVGAEDKERAIGRGTGGGA